MKVDTIDNLFIEKLRAIKLHPTSIVLKSESGYVNTQKLHTDLKKVSDGIRNLTNALMENASSSASSYIVAQIEQLDKEKRLLEKRLHAAEQSNRAAATAAETKENIYRDICRLLDNFDDMTYKEKNELLKNTVTSCILADDEIRIIF